MSDLLDPENPCGQSLLKLVSRGQAILAELQRLSHNIPRIFIESGQNKDYDKILLDFKYWKSIDECEDTIQQNQELIAIDEHFKETYVDLLERFYILFESIHTYYCDIHRVLEEITDGVFVQYTYENLLQHSEGKKLVCEMYFVYGCMLLLMDRLIIGPVRERLIVAYYRYKGGMTNLESLNDVIKLTVSTGYLPAAYSGQAKDKRPQYYPEELFNRFSFESKYIELVINTIKDDDIYKCKSAYPAENVSSALSQQASMLFVILFFYGDILEAKKAKMRELVDKHFSDNWVIPFYLGYYVDLTVEWADYDAAKKALENTLDLEYIQELTNMYKQSLEDCYKKCDDFLVEGVMDEEFVLENIKDLMKCLTKSNVTLRWLILHKNSSMKKIKGIINEGLKLKDILSLLLITSKFEGKLIKCLEDLILSKEGRLNEDKATCVQRMREVSEIFGGQRSTLGNVVQDQNFSFWFTSVGDKINNIEYTNYTSVGRKLNKLIQALEDIENYHQLAHNQSIKFYLAETKKDLKHMIKVSQVQNTLLATVSLISDISYAWQCLPEYIPCIQEKIQKHPQVSLLLKSTFQKLSSILNTPMIRIIQSDSADIQSVSKYYSGELIKFVKKILQIIPQEVFTVLHKIIELLREKMQVIPWKFKKAELKAFAQYDERKLVAQHILRISLFTQSILGMENYLVGVIEVNPKEILDEGIRKELIKLIFTVLDSNLKFKRGDIDDFESKLNILANNLEGFKRAIEQIQDFIQVYGIKAFHEEFDRLINCYIDMEQNFYLTGNLQFEEMLYDEDIPIPEFKEKTEPGTINFMGRLLKALIELTDQRSTVYIDHSLGFFELNTGREILTMKTLGLLYKCIGLSGMNGLDRLLSYNISTEIRKIVKLFQREIKFNTQKQLQEIFDSDLKHLNAFTGKQEEQFPKLRILLKNLLHELTPRIQKLGQMVLLRKVICLQLSIMAKVGSQRLYLCLENLNNGILNDMQNRIYDKQMSEEDTLKENEILYEASKLFNFTGMSEPINKIYLNPENIENLPLVFALATQQLVSHIDFDPKINCLVKKVSREQKKQNDYEPNYFLYGTLTFLNQFHPNNREIYFGFLANHIKSQFNQILSFKEKEPQKYYDMAGDQYMYIQVYDALLKITGDSENSHLNELLPIELINQFKRVFKQ